nr:MAG TPA: SeqA protein/DNA Complex-DNA complex, Recognition of hemimethylated.5A [Caudoviricetes sp.]
MKVLISYGSAYWVLTNERHSPSSQRIRSMHHNCLDFFTRSHKLVCLNFHILTLYNILKK